MTDLQTQVALAADRAEAHAGAPALLLQAQAALGRLAESANAATEGGRLPFRVGPDWHERLGDLAHVAYLLADQTGVNLEAGVRSSSARIQTAAADRALRASQVPGDQWI